MGEDLDQIFNEYEKNEQIYHKYKFFQTKSLEKILLIIDSYAMKRRN